MAACLDASDVYKYLSTLMLIEWMFGCNKNIYLLTEIFIKA